MPQGFQCCNPVTGLSCAVGYFCCNEPGGCCPIPGSEAAPGGGGGGGAGGGANLPPVDPDSQSGDYGVLGNGGSDVSAPSDTDPTDPER